MNCDEFQQRLTAAIETHDLANGTESLAMHVEQCGQSECSRRWSESQRLSTAISAWRVGVPQVDVAGPVIDELLTGELRSDKRKTPRSRIEATYRMVQLPADIDRKPSSSHSTSPRTSGRSWGVAMTAAVAVLLLSSLLTLSQPASTSTEDIAHNLSTTGDQTDGVTRPEVASTNTPEWQFVSRYVDLPLSASEFMTDAVVMVVPADLAVDEHLTGNEEPTRTARWTSQIEERWEPLGRELSIAFEAVLDAVPSSSGLPSST